MPRVVVLAGINGAGKTTASHDLLTSVLKIPTFVNADAIARGLNGLHPEAEAFRAGRIMLDQLNRGKCTITPTGSGCCSRWVHPTTKR